MAFKIGGKLISIGFITGYQKLLLEFHKIFKTNQVDVSGLDESLLL